MGEPDHVGDEDEVYPQGSGDSTGGYNSGRQSQASGYWDATMGEPLTPGLVEAARMEEVP